ncbi:VOC family protein [Rhizobium sp. BK376]|uniref:VOC family protein n=1 Tax=Rhizobium sp. BK376 TaxID=2512149 RepID=UPI00104D8608|nr:VOC family protein [Rhizobium sp. BK376]TCR85506.1 putative lactoylglutathione lyase [Rhizobium sp. BK376]
MLDHITIGVTDVERSKGFYDTALHPLGIERLYAEGETFAGYGIKPKAFFWIGHRNGPQTSVHIAFSAQNRAMVDRFYEAALAAGGRDNGPPGIRAHYHPDYYGAFVLDPDGHNVEAVCRAAAD